MENYILILYIFLIFWGLFLVVTESEESLERYREKLKLKK